MSQEIYPEGLTDEYYTAESEFTGEEEKSDPERDYHMEYTLDETSGDKSTAFLIKWKGMRMGKILRGFGYFRGLQKNSIDRGEAKPSDSKD